LFNSIKAQSFSSKRLFHKRILKHHWYITLYSTADQVGKAAAAAAAKRLLAIFATEAVLFQHKLWQKGII
jgi:hypothetical protein